MPMDDKALATFVASPAAGPYFVPGEPLPRRTPGEVPPIPSTTQNDIHRCAAGECAEEAVSWGVCGGHLAAAFGPPDPGEEDGICAVCHGPIVWAPHGDLPHWAHKGPGDAHLAHPETL
jgi:hypothetical protein